MNSAFQLLFLCNSAALHLRSDPLLVVDSEAYREEDEAEYRAELSIATDFRPSHYLTAAWSNTIFSKQFAQQGKEAIPATCAAMVVAWAQALAPRANKKAPDLAWTKLHPECMDPFAGMEMCHHAFEVPLYRLGDLVLYHKTNLPEYTTLFFPQSIGAKYIAMTSKKKQISVLSKILNENKYQNYAKPSSTEVVVHLRLGDAYAHMKKNNFYYAGKIGQIKRAKANISSVTLVFGDHHLAQMATVKGGVNEKNARKLEDSLKRINQIESFFSAKGYKVSKRINFNADCDVVYMGHAKYFIAAGGGFSFLMASIVHERGGRVL